MTPIRAPFSRVLSLIRREIADPTPNMDVVAFLAEIGQRVCDAAQNTKKPGNVTGNQWEAFGYGVYFNGKRYKVGLGREHDYHESASGNGNAKGSMKDPRRGKWGFGEALNTVRRHKSESTGYELYLTNAMWYSAYHEPRLPVLSQEIKEAVSEIEDTLKVDVQINLNTYGAKGTTANGTILLFNPR